ncbi:MAG: DUF1819 family protein [Armatimonadetes bacterium]|nr:DUF1819 family protein [Armatimonadota bacterium]
MARQRLTKFGQELYLRDTLRVAAMLADTGMGRGASDAAAELLELPSNKTRERVAAKLVQRLSSGASRATDVPAFLRLLSNVRDTTARRELVYYATARADPLVGAIAREVLYPVLIDGATPVGASRDDLSPHRTGLLLTVEPIVTIRFVLGYAEAAWGFRSKRCVLLALRILRQAGITRTQRMRGASGAVGGILAAPHDIAMPTFLWCLMDEFGQATPAATVDRVQRSSFARAFVVSPALMDARLEQAERDGFLHMRVIAGARRVVPCLSLEEMVGRLVAE